MPSFQKLPLELWMIIAAELSLGDLSLLYEIFSTVKSLRSIFAEQAIKYIYVALLTGPVESQIIIPVENRDSKLHWCPDEFGRGRSWPSPVCSNQRRDIVVRRCWQCERKFTLRSKLKVTMTLKVSAENYLIGRHWYLDQSKDQPIPGFEVILNMFDHSGHDACCEGCGNLSLKYKNAAQVDNGKKKENRKETKNRMRNLDLKLESAIWSNGNSPITYPLPLSWFWGFGQAIRASTHWGKVREGSMYTRLTVRDLSILFEDLTVPISKDLLRQLPAEITER
jgi:hypothetical protein